MEEIKNSLNSLLDSAEEYGKTSVELIKLKVLEQTSAAVSSIISRSVAIFILFMFFLLATIGAAIWLGEITGKYSYGFFIVAAFYGVTGAIMYFFMHKKIKLAISNSIIKQFLNK